MYRTQCVLALLAMYVGLAHSFSWEIVVAVNHRLEFYDINGTLTHIENIPWGTMDKITYDPVHKKVLYTDLTNIYSFETATKKTECLIRTTTAHYVSNLAYDPATELLFWIESKKDMYWTSLKFESNNIVNEKHLILSEESISDIAVDSCGGYVYWVLATGFQGVVKSLQRARFNGSEVEIVLGSQEYSGYQPKYFSDTLALFERLAGSYHFFSFTIDQQTQKMCWVDHERTVEDTPVPFFASVLKCADLNGKNIRTVHKAKTEKTSYHTLTWSKDQFYWHAYDEGGLNTIWKMPKNTSSDIDVESKLFIAHYLYVWDIAAYYNIEDITRVNQNCDALKSLLPNNSVSTDESLLCVHGTKVSGESRCECTHGYSGERCDFPVCKNYCFQGDCSVSAEGQPKCSCYDYYIGERCEMNICRGYCFNNGVCSRNEKNEPLCQCTEGHGGDRCQLTNPTQ